MAQNSGFTKSFSRDARSTMMHGAELLGHRAGRGGARVKIHEVGWGKKMPKSNISRQRAYKYFFGQCVGMVWSSWRHPPPVHSVEVKTPTSTDLWVRKIFIGQNWILPCNCLPNFNGLKSTLPRSAPRRFWHYGRIPWKGFWNPSLLEDIIKILCRNMIFISGVSIKRPQVLAYFLFLLIELRGRR